MLSEIEITIISSQELEILGEKAFPEGLIDILMKEATPIGMTRKIISEIKTGAAKAQDIEQLKTYRNEIAEECLATTLIAKKFNPSMIKTAQKEHINLIRYTFDGLDKLGDFYTFEDLLHSLRLEIIKA